MILSLRLGHFRFRWRKCDLVGGVEAALAGDKSKDEVVGFVFDARCSS
jgi:hypothetical protein